MRKCCKVFLKSIPIPLALYIVNDAVSYCTILSEKLKHILYIFMGIAALGVHKVDIIRYSRKCGESFYASSISRACSFGKEKCCCNGSISLRRILFCLNLGPGLGPKMGLNILNSHRYILKQSYHLALLYLGYGVL